MSKEEGGATLLRPCSGSCLDQVSGQNIFETTVGECLISPSPRPCARFSLFLKMSNFIFLGFFIQEILYCLSHQGMYRN